MISQTMLISRKFNACIAANVPNGYFKHENTESGIASSWLYFFSGDGYIVADDGRTETFETKKLYDIAQYIGTPLSCHANENGYFHAAFNFKPVTRRVDAELLNTPTVKTVIGGDKQQMVFCLSGAINCNGVEMGPWKFADIPTGREVEITVPDGAVAVLFTDK